MRFPPDWILYGGAILLAVLGFRVAGAFSRPKRGAALQARVSPVKRSKRLLKKALSRKPRRSSSSQ